MEGSWKEGKGVIGGGRELVGGREGYWRREGAGMRERALLEKFDFPLMLIYRNVTMQKDTECML